MRGHRDRRNRREILARLLGRSRGGKSDNLAAPGAAGATSRHRLISSREHESFSLFSPTREAWSAAWRVIFPLLHPVAISYRSVNRSGHLRSGGATAYAVDPAPSRVWSSPIDSSGTARRLKQEIDSPCGAPCLRNCEKREKLFMLARFEIRIVTSMGSLRPRSSPMCQTSPMRACRELAQDFSRRLRRSRCRRHNLP